MKTAPAAQRGVRFFILVDIGAPTEKLKFRLTDVASVGLWSTVLDPNRA